MTLEDAIKRCEEVVELKYDEGSEARLQEQDKRETTARDAVRRLIGKMNDDEYIAIMIKQEGKE